MTPKEAALAVENLLNNAGYRMTGVQFTEALPGGTGSYRFAPNGIDGKGGYIVPLANDECVVECSSRPVDVRVTASGDGRLRAEIERIATDAVCRLNRERPLR
ncbi:MAG: hypothetical protein CMJ32_10880 [Phycisphaerae bacterium]|nr:hypothetical protein [Phycisphaerae bacterium]